MTTGGRTVFLLGTSHEYQLPLEGPAGREPEQFRLLVDATCRRECVKAIGEEASRDLLERKGVSESVCKRVADSLGIAHRYCDPSTMERKALGVVDEEDIRMSGFFAKWDQQRTDAAVRASHAIRERRWLDQVLELDSWPLLFICGAHHTNPFRALLEANGLAVRVLYTNWTPN